jgi:DNA replication initiation complex subunit (GINS family)
MITFSDIYEAMRKDKYSEELQVLPPAFLAESAKYFSEKKDFLNKEEDLFSDIALRNKKKLENALSSFRDLLRIRKKKILNLAFVASEAGISKRDFSNLLSFEKDLFEEIVRGLDKAEGNMNAEMLGAEKDTRKQSLVRFLEDVPEFLGFDGTEVGPFEKGEVANLEKEIVDILSKDKRVEIIEE